MFSDFICYAMKQFSFAFCFTAVSLVSVTVSYAFVQDLVPDAASFPPGWETRLSHFVMM